MRTDRYTLLMTELAQLYNCEPHTLLQESTITINDTTFRFQHYHDDSTESILLYCQYGALPTERYTEACIALLKANLLLFYSRGPKTMFTISPIDEKVWLADSYPLDGVSVTDLSNYLRHTTAQVKLWQHDYFLAA